MYKRVKNGIFNILHSEKNQNKAAKIFDLFIIGLIIINLIMVIADTFTLPDKLSNIMSYLETFSVIIFSIEYILRVWTADLVYSDLKPAKARIKYILSFMALIDLVAILPFYIPFLIKIDLRALRALRTVRLLRIFKMNRYTKALSTIADVFRRKASQLQSSQNRALSSRRCGVFYLFKSFLRYCPVYDSLTSATCLGVPAATTEPPLSPPSGPRSII